jgi:hypothetical protein
MRPSIEELLRLMLPCGMYLERCDQSLPQLSLLAEDPIPDPPERFAVFDKQGIARRLINGKDLEHWRIWSVLKKDNTLAYRKKINRYYISRRKILALRKNHPIKSTYKRLRATPSL